MAARSQIEWTEMTWNPVTGCTKVSQGCKFCYAERMAKRLKAMGMARYANGFDLALHEDILEKPYRWVKPRVVFVNSMIDLFHEDVPVEFIQLDEAGGDPGRVLGAVRPARTERSLGPAGGVQPVLYARVPKADDVAHAAVGIHMGSAVIQA